MSTKKGNKEIIWFWWCYFENLVDYYDDGTETLTKEKVIKVYIVKDCIMHKEYLNVCDKTMSSIVNKKYNMYSVSVMKISWSPFNDKRYIADDKVMLWLWLCYV